MYIFRSKETYDIYEEYKKNGHLEEQCQLCNATVLKEFEYWKVVHNKFPYDRISDTHHMIIPKRHVVEAELNAEERDELYKIKSTYLDENYTYILEALPRKKSIPSHFHQHVIVPKDII